MLQPLQTDQLGLGFPPARVLPAGWHQLFSSLPPGGRCTWVALEHLLHYHSHQSGTLAEWRAPSSQQGPVRSTCLSHKALHGSGFPCSSTLQLGASQADASGGPRRLAHLANRWGTGTLEARDSPWLCTHFPVLFLCHMTTPWPRPLVSLLCYFVVF